jgi:hypothetical protein
MVYLSRRTAQAAAHYHLRRGRCARFELRPATVRNPDKTVEIGFKVATFDARGRFLGNLSTLPVVTA